MTQYGPHNAPLVLATRPWGCLFWAIWAMMLIPPAVLSLANLIVPGIYEAAFKIETIEAYSQRWILLSMGVGLTLVTMMAWAEYIGAGPFAGPVRLPMNWALGSIIGGPALLFFVMFILDMIFGGGETNWAIREDISAELMNPANYGILFAFLIIIIHPVAEEIAYRGIGLGFFLARGMEPAFAIGLVALIWTLTHTQLTPLGLIPVFIAGVFFGWLRVKTGSMAAPLLAHISANGVQFLL